MPYLDLLTRQARTLSLPIILTLLMGIFPLQPVSADPIAAPGIKNLPPPAAGQTAPPAELLQFTSGGHALGFEPEGVYLAARDHVLRENFAGTGGVMPVADQTPNADGQAQPLGTVAYPDLWPGITLIYDSPPGGILRSTVGKGRVWTKVTAPTTAHLWDVSFYNAKLGWAVGDKGTILHTKDGGAVWKLQPTGVTDRLESVCFTSATDGWAVGAGGVMLHTTTGGS